MAADVEKAGDVVTPDVNHGDGRVSAQNNPPEKQELLHRPHAFALMHGSGGAKIAYGELHWRIDVFTLQFETSTASGVSVTVDDHANHSHAPHDDHSHADHTDHPSHTHTAGVASHDHDHSHTHEHDHTHTAGVASHTHDHDHTHELVHTHTTDLGGATSTGQPDDATTGTDVAAVSGYGSTSSQTTTTSGIQSGSGYGDHTHDIAHGHDVAMSHTHEHDHTHSISQHSHTTTSIDDATTDSISSVTTGNVNGSSGTVTTSSPDDSTTGVPNNITTGNVNSGSGTVTTSGPNATLTHSSHSGVKTTSHGTPATTSGILKHSGVTTLDGNGQGTSSDASGSSSGVLSHNVTVSGGLNSIIYCSGASQSAIGNITQQVPKVQTEDGTAMDAGINETKYHELGSFGDVYLVWKVDLENVGGEVEKCWVQVGDPAGDGINEVPMGNSTTDRRAAGNPKLGTGQPEGDAEGVFKIKIGTVTESNEITQLVSSDVVWSPTVMDRVQI